MTKRNAKAEASLREFALGLPVACEAMPWGGSVGRVKTLPLRFDGSARYPLPSAFDGRRVGRYP